MDSVNSGSLQSSSGGDEEYDSRAESISAFLNNPSSHVGPMPNPPQPPPPPQQQQLPHHHRTQTSSMFDPLSNYFDHPSLSRSNPNSLLNLDTVWSKTLRSDPNCTDLGNIMASPPSNQPFSTSQGQARGNFGTSSPAMMQFPPAPENATRASASSASSDQTNIVRSNSKKRSRASRRAPTTVLTTDTTNFRAMVQEFTGIPAPPFTSSPFPRSRLDLFGTPSSMRSSHHFDSSTPPYLLRPFAQKLQPQPPPPPFVSSSSSSSFPSSSMVDAAATASTTNITSGSSNHTSNSTSINYQLPSDFALLKQHPQNPLNLHNNPILTFQSLLQTPPRYNPLANSAILGSKPQGSLEIPSNDPHLKMGGLEEFGLSHGHVSTHLGGGLQNIVSSDGTASLRRDNHHPPSWGGDGAGSNNDGDQGLLRSLNGNYSHSQRVTNGKLHFSSASSSDFHGDKGSENVSTRSEGMVESWICSD